jgi:hypothetical protein
LLGFIFAASWSFGIMSKQQGADSDAMTFSLQTISALAGHDPWQT